MAKERRNHLDDLLSGSEDLLKNIDTLEEISRAHAPGEPTPAQEQARRKFQRQGYTEYLPFDGYAEISVKDDEMLVTGHFYPPGEGMQPIDPDTVNAQLHAKQVVHGVDWDAISEAIFRCNTEGVEVPDVVIARGREPRNAVTSHIVLEKRAGTKMRFDKDDSDRVDYRSASPFVLVKPDEVLARIKPARSGADGETVTGRKVAFQTTKTRSLQPGKNTERRGDAIVSTREGRFQADSSSFWVNEVLEITDDVDYSTGHVDFPGDVLLRGEVKDGFKIKAGGSVFCATTMDASEVDAEGDLVVKKGLIGRKTGTVRVSGNVSVRFIENCYVEAGGRVSVDVGILHSAVYAGDRVEVGSRGIIVGGEIHCQNGLSATQIGTETGARTEIYCGTDYQVEQKLEWVRDKTVALAEKLREVEHALERGSGDRRNLEALQHKLHEGVRRMNESAQTLVFQLDKNEDATVRVRGSIVGGTYIEICHVSHVVDRKVSSVQFWLDKKSGRIQVGSLGRVKQGTPPKRRSQIL